MAISTNQKPTIYRNLYENTGPGIIVVARHSCKNRLPNNGYMIGLMQNWHQTYQIISELHRKWVCKSTLDDVTGLRLVLTVSVSHE